MGLCGAKSSPSVAAAPDESDGVVGSSGASEQPPPAGADVPNFVHAGNPNNTSSMISPNAEVAPTKKGWTKIKVLILGTGGSGKSTIFKQAAILGSGFGNEARDMWASRMVSRLLEVARVKEKAEPTPGFDIRRLYPKTPETPEKEAESRKAAAAFASRHLSETPVPMSGNETYTTGSGTYPKPGPYEGQNRSLSSGGPGATTASNYYELQTKEERLSVIEAIAELLADPPEVENVLNRTGSGYMLDASTKMLLKRCHKMCDAMFVPTNDEIVRFTYPTRLIQHVMADFPSSKVTLELVDVGGQRTERIQWPTLAAECDTVLFVSSLDDYHQTLDEDVNKNRMKESLQTFKLMMGKYLPNKQVILFLNKKDLFRSSMAKHPMADYFPDYEGEQGESTAAVHAARNHIASMFKSAHSDSSTKKGFSCKFTSAVDTNGMGEVFKYLSEATLETNLALSGFRT